MPDQEFGPPPGAMPVEPESVIPLEQGEDPKRGLPLPGQEWTFNTDHPECPWCHGEVLPLATDMPFRTCNRCGGLYEVYLETVPIFLSRRYHAPETERAALAGSAALSEGSSEPVDTLLGSAGGEPGFWG
jgi:hypothetical protein